MKKIDNLRSNNTNGYSIIEVIVALQLFMIVLSFAYTLYHFQCRFMSKWHSDSQMLNANVSTNQLFEGLSTKVTMIHRIEQNALIYDDENRQKKILESKDSFLYLNSKRINSPKTKITFNVVYLYYSFRNKVSEFNFSYKDVNRDGVLDKTELEGIRAIKIDIVYSNINQTIRDLKYIEFVKLN